MTGHVVEQLSREATLESMEVKGTLSLTANSDGANKCKVVLASTDPTGAFAFQTHPKVLRTVDTFPPLFFCSLAFSLLLF